MHTQIIKTKDEWFGINSIVQRWFANPKNEGKSFEVTLDSDYKAKKPKTTPQLRYLHGIVIPIMKEIYEGLNGISYSLEGAKYQLKQDIGFGEWVQVVMKGVPLPLPVFVPKSFAGAKIEDISHAIDKAKEIALIAGVEIPPPTTEDYV